MTKILVTGGTGYIGSHTCLALIAAGHDVYILDNLSNSHIEVLSRIRQISGKMPAFIKGDIRDIDLLLNLFKTTNFDAVIHFAGLKVVNESFTKPLDYYDINVGGTLELLKVMRAMSVKTFIFSSSAAVYGDSSTVPILEDFSRNTSNPYGFTKLAVENILEDLHRAEPDWKIARLRYFNPVGAHESGLIGEDPRGTPGNLMPYIAGVASGRYKKLAIFGNDYPTSDGTGIRDYIHVVDLANGHVLALNYLEQQGGILTVNLGTGQGYSVLELVKTFEDASGVTIPFEIVERRVGDIATCWADTTRAQHLLNWNPQKNLVDMCADTWRWQLNHPCGYDTAR